MDERLSVIICVEYGVIEGKFEATVFYTMEPWSDDMTMAAKFCKKLGEIGGAIYETNNGKRYIRCFPDVNKRELEDFVAKVKKAAKYFNAEVTVDDFDVDENF